MPEPIPYSNSEPDLFAFPPARTDPMRLAASVAAAISGKRRDQIIALLRDIGPMALWQLAERLGLHDNQISGRMTDLKRDGLIEPTGDRIARPGSTATAEVYRLVTPERYG